jgi:RNA polymerase sigma factor (sigma-70 family)
MNEKPTVFIVDDDANARESLAALVRSMDVAFECFSSAEEFLSQNLSNRPGCVVTDLRMMGMSGLDLQAKLAELESALAIVVVSAHASVPLAVKAVQDGAVTFLEKTCTEHELWEAIRDALLENEARLQKKQERDELRAALASLTDDERKVLELIAKGQANKQVAQVLSIGLRTVEDRRRRVMQKLAIEPFAELMRFFVKAETASSELSPVVNRK